MAKKSRVPTLNDAAHPLYGAAGAALGVARGRQSGNAMNEAVQAMAKREPVLAAAPDLLAAMRKIAYEPIGRPEATDREVLDAITELARAAIKKAEGAKQ